MALRYLGLIVVLVAAVRLRTLRNRIEDEVYSNMQ
jgi:hypothetical protein